MNRIKLLLALLGMSLCTAVYAAEPGMCKSMCATDKQECRAKAKWLTDVDHDVLLEPEGKNPFARTNSQGQVATTEARAREQADTHRRVSERNSQCDTTYLRCTRACGGSAGGTSVLVKPGRAASAQPPSERPSSFGATLRRPEATEPELVR